MSEFVEEKETEISVLKKAFLAAYFLMKEYLPNRKFLPLIEFYSKCDRGG